MSLGEDLSVSDRLIPATFFVIAGLDPAIQVPGGVMDPRVKPEGDIKVANRSQQAIRTEPLNCSPTPMS